MTCANPVAAGERRKESARGDYHEKVISLNNPSSGYWVQLQYYFRQIIIASFSIKYFILKVL